MFPIKELLWEEIFPEEKLKESKRAIFTPSELGEKKVCCLEGEMRESFQNSSRFTNNDTAIKKPKGFIGQLKKVFEFSKSSVNSWKDWGEERRISATRHLRKKIIGYFLLPLGAITMGFVFGDDSLFSEELNHSLKIIGMSHVVSASGYNISVLVSMISPCFSRFWARRSLSYFLLISIWLYIWLAGSSPSLVRAGVMSVFAFVGTHSLLRQVKPLRVLLLTGGLLAVLNKELALSISFQLSFSATLGLIMFMPWISQSNLAGMMLGLPGLSNHENPVLSKLKQVSSLFWDGFLTTLAAQAFTVPLIWKHFQELSLISLVSNAALLWLAPIITLSSAIGVIAAVLSGFLPFSSSFLSIVTGVGWILAEVFTRGVAFFAGFKGSLLIMPELSWGGVGIWWGFLLLLSWQLSRQKYLSQNRKLDELYAY